VGLCLALALGGARGQDPAPDLDGAQWIWAEPGAAAGAAAGRHAFRTTFTCGGAVERGGAQVTISADNLFELFLNGAPVCANPSEIDAWRSPRTAAVGHLLRAGTNVLAVAATNTVPGAAGLILKLVGREADGGVVAVTSDDQWRCSGTPAAGWEGVEFDDSSWAPAYTLGPLGLSPWGDLGLRLSAAAGLDFAGAQWIWTAEEGVQPGAFPAAVRYFRATFEAPAGLRGCRAEIAMTCDNAFTLYLNGRRVGRGGEWNEPARFDLTRLLIPGRNQVAVMATNTLPGPAGLIAKLILTRPGRAALTQVSDASWKAIADVLPGWETADCDDRAWGPARVMAPFGGGPWGEVKVPATAQVQWTFTRERDYADPVYSGGVVFVQGAVIFGSAGENFIQNIGMSRAYTEFDTPSPAALGSRLYCLRPFRPGGQLTLLHDAGVGLLGGPTVSYDGQTIYFTLAPAGETYFHIFAVQADGTGLRQITRGAFHDFDPAELPDGRLVFASTRLGTAEEYHGVAAFALFTSAPDGSDVRPLTHHVVGDREPRVTADGSLVFIRCDNFLERGKVETHIHRTRLDGSCGEIVIGPDREPIIYDRPTAAESSSSWLRLFGAGSPAPLPDGRIAAITERGVVVSPGRRGTIIGRYVPYDLSPLPDGRLLCTAHDRLRLCLLDPATGAVTEVLPADELALAKPGPGQRRPGLLPEEIHSAVYLAPRPRPPERPALPEPGGAGASAPTGFLYCQNALNTRHASADVGRIRAVRVYEGRPFTLVPTSSIYVHIGTEGRELGTVPLAADGSFFAEVPADRALSLQAVDAEGRPVINELSWIYVRPGERRACVGCHAPTDSAPPRAAVKAAAMVPLRLLGEGEAHRFRANNAANGGVLNQQLGRFREVASVNLHRLAAGATPRPAGPLQPGRPAEVSRLCQAVESGTPADRLAALQQLAIFRDRQTVPVLVQALGDAAAEVRTAAGLGLAACGDRRAVAPLLEALDDAHPAVAQAAHVALEHLTCRQVAFDASASGAARGADAWRRLLARPDWESLESELEAALAGTDRLAVYAAIEALGHVGGPAGAAALRQYVGEHPEGELRHLEAALRALGHLRDHTAVPLLSGILRDHLVMAGEGGGGREFGFAQRPVYLAAAAAEALGWIGTAECEAALLAALPHLPSLEDCNLACGDHPWLMGSHPPVIHYRVLEALDAMGSRQGAAVAPVILRAIPMDKDRALLYERDSYETLTARVLQRSGSAEDIVETCLAVLGDASARRREDLLPGVTASPHAEAHIRPHSTEARAAQVLAVVCLDPAYAGRIRERLSAYLSKPPAETRSWVCFMLCRSLAALRDPGAVALLSGVLTEEPDETAAGVNLPPSHWVHKAQKPFFRAAAAFALGQIGDRAAAPVLSAAVQNASNAPAVRQQAASALGRLADPRLIPELAKLAAAEPDQATRRALLEASTRPVAGGR
jgi:HEAT repeat protein